MTKQDHNGWPSWRHSNGLVMVGRSTKCPKGIWYRLAARSGQSMGHSSILKDGPDADDKTINATFLLHESFQVYPYWIQFGHPAIKKSNQKFFYHTLSKEWENDFGPPVKKEPKSTIVDPTSPKSGKRKSEEANNASSSKKKKTKVDKDRPVRGESAIVAAWLDWRSVDPTDDEYAILQKYVHSEVGASPPRDMLMRVRRSMKPFQGALGVYDMTDWQLWLTDVKSERDLKDPQPYNPPPSPQPSLLASTSNSSRTGPMLSTVTPEPGSASRSATPPAHRKDIIDTRTPARRPSQKTSLSSLFPGFEPGRIDPTQQQAWTVASAPPTSPVPMPPTSPTSTNIFRKPTMHPPSMLSPTTAMKAANNTASRGGSMPTIKELIREQTMRLRDKRADLRGRSASGPLTVEPGDPHRPGSTASRQPNLDNDTPQPPGDRINISSATWPRRDIGIDVDPHTRIERSLSLPTLRAASRHASNAPGRFCTEAHHRGRR